MTESEARKAGWLRFMEVTGFLPDGQKLYRSSAPNYKKLPSGDHDSSQDLTQKSVDFLTKIGIDSIISFNKYKYNRDALVRLESAKPKKIEYLHLSVQDFSAPTLEQLKEANTFFVGKKATLVHCGYGHGRTGTGVTALQIDTSNGQRLEPFASAWWGSRGNHVEKRRQMSVLAELRSVLLQNKTVGVPVVGQRKNFAIINLATGYYLTVSEDNKTIVALSPETVERGPRTKRQYLWAIIKDKTTNNYTLSNRVTYDSFAITKSSDAKVDDVVANGPRAEGANNLFAITEAQGPDHGFYIIAPTPNKDSLALSINEPDDSLKRLYESKEMPALLSARNEQNKFGLWILLPVLNATGMRP